MPTGLKSYIEVQIGKETVPGTPVVPTARLHGVYNATQTEDRTKITPEELRGTLTRMYRTITVGRLGRINLEGTALFQDLGYYFGMAIKGGVVGVSDVGSPPAFTYDFAPTITSEDIPQTATIRHVDRAANHEFNYAFASSLEISAAIDQLTNVRTALLAQKREVSTVAAGLAQREVEDLVANNWIAYIDNSGGTIGTTEFAGCITGLTWRIPQTFQAHKCLSGGLTFTDVHQMPIQLELDLTMEVNNEMLAYLQQYEDDTRLLVRLENSGSLIHGTVHNRLRIDGAYQIRNIGEFGAADQEGVNTVQLQLRGEYDPTWGKLYEVELVNSLATLP